ncbi:hypothetical protein [Burkholderia sp. Bp8963]|uniref:hypothetical protein n=1 Tax=Burkholderia sp. Bp8963 TaxID=2184547 RepID=UPI00163A087D|nr:hypothetical protein [Burkholderia sp. Bp8963]
MFRIPGIPSTMRAFRDGWRRVARHAVAASQKEPDMIDATASPPPEPVLDLFRTED